MRKRLVYIPGSGAPEISLDGPLSWTQGGAAGLRGRAWNRTLGFRDLFNATRPAREVSVVVFAAFGAADELRRAADADVAQKTPGTLLFDGAWRQKAYILESESTPHYNGVILELTIALMEGAWWAIQEKSFTVDAGTSTEDYLDYPFDYEYDFGAPASADSVDTGLLVPSPIRLTIFGPATNPYVVIGANRYQVNVTIPNGGYLVVDGMAHTIRLVAQNGTVTDAFAQGERGSGQGGGNYIFEPIPAGETSVSWDRSFGFDLGWYDLEGEPPWSRS